LNLNNTKKGSKRQGFGYFHWHEHIEAEGAITEFLYWLEETYTKFDPNVGDTHPYGTIRSIERGTRLHHTTINKAIERLKKRGSIIEVYGKRNARLFTLYDSPNADQIRKKTKDDPDYKKWIQKINSKKVLKELKRDKDGFAMPLLKFTQERYVKRILKKQRKIRPIIESRHGDEIAYFMNRVKKKKHLISSKNRKKRRVLDSLKG